MPIMFKLQSQLVRCPICKEKPLLGYACGDFFVFCAEECPAPMCDCPTEEVTVRKWNEWARGYPDMGFPITEEGADK